MSIQIIDVNEATALKEKGNQHFHKKEYDQATKFYYDALKFCSITNDDDELLIPQEEQEATSQTTTNNNEATSAETTTGENKEEETSATTTITETVEESEEDKQCKQLEVILRANLAACFVNMGSYNRAITECTRALKIDPKHSKALYRRFQAYEALGQIEESFNDVKLLYETNPDSQGAKAEYERLEKKLEVKRKEEMDKMLGQLKDLGSSLLGKFGLSLDNFKMQQDPQTGSYSFNMNNNGQ
jgi:tetratricopeptide (TPR) repeat protein